MGYGQQGTEQAVAWAEAAAAVHSRFCEAFGSEVEAEAG